MLEYRPEKNKVAQSFADAAKSYDEVAVLQRHTADTLLSHLTELSIEPKTILDLGTGTGRNLPLLQQRYPNVKLIALDMAAGMLEKAKTNCADRSNIEWIKADIESMPIETASVDVVFANLAIQWCDPERSFAQIRRVLADEGIAVITTLADNTLVELKQAWAEVDDYPHVNQFHSMAQLESAINQQNFSDVDIITEQQQLFYLSPMAMMRDLKLLGARNVNQGRRTGLTGKGLLQNMINIYEQYRQPEGVPATYEVVYLLLKKGQK